MANTTIRPTGPTLAATGGTPSLGSGLRPTGPTLAATTGTPVLVLAWTLVPAAAALVCSCGTAALVLAVVLAPGSAALAAALGGPAVMVSSPTDPSRVIEVPFDDRRILVSAWASSPDLTDAERQYALAEVADIAARQGAG